MAITNRRILLLSLYLLFVYVMALVVYGVTEHHGLWDSAWWGLMTFTTVGYGDEYPHTVAGRIMGIVLVMSAVFVVVPTITAFVSSRFIVDDHEWTHDEQEQVKDDLKEILRILKDE